MRNFHWLNLVITVGYGNDSSLKREYNHISAMDTVNTAKKYR